MIYQRSFIAVGELGAAETVRPDLARQFHFIDFSELISFEKFGSIREAEYRLDAEFFRLFEAGGNEPGAPAGFLFFFRDSDRPYFRKVRPADMQSGAGNDFLAIPDYKKVTYTLVNLAQWPGEHQAFFRKAVNELVYLGNIGYFSFFYLTHLVFLSIYPQEKYRTNSPPGF